MTYRLQGRARILFAILVCLTFALPVLMGCASTPTCPSAPQPTGPTFIWIGASAEQQAYGNQLWVNVANCVGIDPARVHNYPVTILRPPMWCGTDPSGKPIGAAGCYYGDHTEVTADYWRSALWYEDVHLALDVDGQNFDGFVYQPGSPYLANLAPTDMANPAFAKCRYLRQTP